MRTTTAMRMTVVLTACVLVSAAGCASKPKAAKPGAAKTPPGSAANSTTTAKAAAGAPKADKPAHEFTAVEKSAMREKALAMLADMARSDSALLRANAIEGLQPVPTRCEPLVRAALVDENVGVRYVAAMTVGRLKLGGTAPMVRPLLNDPDPSVRAAAIYALTLNGVKVDQTELSSILMEGSMRARSNVAYILGQIGNSSAVALLRDSVRQPGASESTTAARLFRLQAAEAMVDLGDATARRAIDAALYPSSPDDLETSVLAAQIIGELKDNKSAQESVTQLRTIVLTPVEGTLVPADPRKGQFFYPKELRLAATGSLNKIGFPGGWWVGDMYANDVDPAVRAQAATVLSQTALKVNESPTLEILDRMMADESSLVRVTSAAAVVSMLERLK